MVAFAAAPHSVGGLNRPLFRDIYRTNMARPLERQLWSQDNKVKNCALNNIGIAQEKLKIPKGTMEITFFDWATIPKYGNNHIRRQPAIQYAEAARMTHTSFTIDKNKNLKITIQDPDLRAQITPKNLHELTKWLKTARDNKYKRWLKNAFSNKDILREETLAARGELIVPSITERKVKQAR
jgi:hypothetical protein